MNVVEKQNQQSGTEPAGKAHKGPVYAGSSLIQQSRKEVTGEYCSLDGEQFYRISNYDCMRSFLMTIVSSRDLWMFISSTGGLTAGRRDPDNALFPYVTDDKLHDAHTHTGSETVVLVEGDGRRMIWEPFSDRFEGAYNVRRNLYKNMIGSKLIFEEENLDLGLVFRYAWLSADRYGWIKRAEIENVTQEKQSVEVLDGIRNLLPADTDPMLQAARSNLLDGYKKAELEVDTGLGIYSLSAIPVDRAEPSEALRSTTVWSTLPADVSRLISENQVDGFRFGQQVSRERDVRAERGAYYTWQDLKLEGGQKCRWYTVAELNQGPDEVARLQHMLSEGVDLEGKLESAVAEDSFELRSIVGSSDAFQRVSDTLSAHRHQSNVLFNVMRGGLPMTGYQIQTGDLRRYVATHNSAVHEALGEWFDGLPAMINLQSLGESVAKVGNRDLNRFYREYLPFSFSRRHGDPSRPWNRFNIILKDDEGNPILDYEGNWRDIFQNWEALALAFPEFLPGMISRFLNASTADGYNPYRITRDGIDWEVIEEDDPWSYIGYWGDHQIIYLLKLLEQQERHHPGILASELNDAIYAYADVPYRIVGYDAMVKDPQDTVLFDDEREELVAKRVSEKGSDGRLLHDGKGEIVRVTLGEKILVPLLVKLANLVPDGGIWLNTQRPEWNDANNALVGNGLSMVTLYYMRRHIEFCRKLLRQSGETLALSTEVAVLLRELQSIYAGIPSGHLNPEQRKTVVESLGRAAEHHRNAVYEGFSRYSDEVRTDELDGFLARALDVLDDSISNNRREDGLYHAYNRMEWLEDGGLAVRFFYPMLEGQVAVLSSLTLKAEEALELLDALRASSLFRADQFSYLLYPDRELPRFTAKNVIPEELLKTSPALSGMIDSGDTSIVSRDVLGAYHFNPSFRNAGDVEEAINESGASGKERILEIWEEVFNHEEFTGRSGTFYAFEGLGSIYWHMVSKLLLAVQEVTLDRIEDRGYDEVTTRLIEHYYEIRAGIGWNKGPATYGAFPSDAYSHTPGHKGAQQPGMTGQVKEDVICRYGELGVQIREGQVSFVPTILRSSEFLTNDGSLFWIDMDGQVQEMPVSSGELAFTYCQVPVLYRSSDKDSLVISTEEGELSVEGRTLSPEWSRSLFNRDRRIKKLTVYLKPQLD